MSASAPEGESRPLTETGATGEQLEFIGSILTANARWSQAVHERVLDNQEQSLVDWANRYRFLVRQVQAVANHAVKDKTITFDDLLEDLYDIVDGAAYWVDRSIQMEARLVERLTQRAEAANAAG